MEWRREIGQELAHCQNLVVRLSCPLSFQLYPFNFFYTNINVDNQQLKIFVLFFIHIVTAYISTYYCSRELLCPDAVQFAKNFTTSHNKGDWLSLSSMPYWIISSSGWKYFFSLLILFSVTRHVFISCL